MIFSIKYNVKQLRITFNAVMDTLLIVIVVLAVLVLIIGLVLKSAKKKPLIVQPIPESFRQLLAEQVVFYKQLSPDKKQEFEKRVQLFLAQVRITGVKTTVEDMDKVFIASSAVIPIFSFPGWEYVNLHEILLYPDSFNHDFEQKGNDRNVLGMVGNGAYNHVMILSQHELRQAFINKTGKSNTALHEFVHLVDKTDGSVDGIPEFILQQQYILPWLQLMHKEIKEILEDKSDINPYGATNEAEFFAVVAEYFFERPELLQQKHPELYQLLSTIFKQQPAKPAAS
ncbi:MAG: zinc-dependent peptidase [Chitinophagaceae bacterium]|nr:zinc-dependent peptidase [Chitinophagaceae bacterium]